jgi:hypothetical protein
VFLYRHFTFCMMFVSCIMCLHVLVSNEQCLMLYQTHALTYQHHSWNFPPFFPTTRARPNKECPKPPTIVPIIKLPERLDHRGARRRRHDHHPAMLPKNVKINGGGHQVKPLVLESESSKVSCVVECYGGFIFSCCPSWR